MGDDFDEYDPTPYGGGYDLVARYGRPLPPSSETCYPPSSAGDSDYHGFSYGSESSPYEPGFSSRLDEDRPSQGFGSKPSYHQQPSAAYESYGVPQHQTRPQYGYESGDPYSEVEKPSGFGYGRPHPPPSYQENPYGYSQPEAEPPRYGRPGAGYHRQEEQEFVPQRPYFRQEETGAGYHRQEEQEFVPERPYFRQEEQQPTYYPPPSEPQRFENPSFYSGKQEDGYRRHKHDDDDGSDEEKRGHRHHHHFRHHRNYDDE
eukprot:TRINITY_DN263_c0_g1_i2.p1 TRINITY_DN263_c0_g1~~TRINITY_DN263_c0_g1_i2.p1  ORF type:complete len:260 (+),score=29.24 TRINITY_DN263_c0_g1_i2:146-925(+)